MDELKPWKRVGSRTLHRHDRVVIREDVLQLPAGRERRYPVMQLGQSAAVVPVAADGQILLVRQYRHVAQSFCWEIPGGGLHPGESPDQAAQRELLEETGYLSDHWVYLADLAPEPNRSSARHHYLLAWDCRLAGAQRLDATEELRVHLIPLDEIEDLALSGNVVTVSTCAGIALGLRYWRMMRGA